MRINDAITSDKMLPKTGYLVVLVSHRWRKADTMRFKSHHVSRPEARQAKGVLLARPGVDADYRVLSIREAKELLVVIQGQQAANRKKGAEKAAKTRKEKGPNNFVRCPTCGAKSKKLFSEMGGLQTRTCSHGHTFEYDKWLDDRRGTALIFAGNIIPESAIKKPVV